MGGGERKTLTIRLDPEVASGFREVAEGVGYNQTALLQAAIEVWIDRWRDGSMPTEAMRNEVSLRWTDWADWLTRARAIQTERKDRGGPVERRAVMIRLDPDIAALLTDTADLLGPGTTTALVQAIVELWWDRWNRSNGLVPALEVIPEPPWWPRWVRIRDLAQAIAAGRKGCPATERKVFMIRFDPWAAEHLAELVAAAETTVTAFLQAAIQMRAENWRLAGLTPTLEWQGDGPKPEWWSRWEAWLVRARQIRERRNER